eukprot:scaffold6.g2661.t1
MKLAALLLALAAACALLDAPALAARSGADAHRKLAEGMWRAQPGRALLQPCGAQSQSQGANYASSSATATSAGGQCVSGTQGAAVGGPATTSQVSVAGQDVQACFKGPSQAVECSTLASSVKSSSCSDIAPDTKFTCAEQAKFGKCDTDFIFLGAFCLSSCGRCGGGCTDVVPSGGSCVFEQCNSTTITSGPFCLKTCQRCFVA